MTDHSADEEPGASGVGLPDASSTNQTNERNSLGLRVERLEAIISQELKAPLLQKVDEIDMVELDLLRENLARVEALVTHELGLVGNRMTWFTISQSFLFSAYAAIATDPTRLALLSTMSANTTTKPGPGATTINLLLYLLPLIGFVFALAALLSVAAAAKVLKHLDPCRGLILLRLNATLRRLGHDMLPVIGSGLQRGEYAEELKNTIYFGSLPQWILPGTMILVWMFVLVLRMSNGG